jgi:predicted DNA-binding transcriptional regulator YafY
VSRAHRLARLLTIVSCVINQPGQRPSALAASVGISERTLFRDLGALRRLGFEVGYQDGYQMQESLDLEGGRPGASLHRVYDRHLELLRTQLPIRFAEQVEADVEARAPAALAALFAGAIERRLHNGARHNHSRRSAPSSN